MSAYSQKHQFTPSINSNILLYGNTYIKQNSFIRGQSTIYGETLLKDFVTMEKSLFTEERIFYYYFTIDDCLFVSIEQDVKCIEEK